MRPATPRTKGRPHPGAVTFGPLRDARLGRYGRRVPPGARAGRPAMIPARSAAR